MQHGTSYSLTHSYKTLHFLFESKTNNDALIAYNKDSRDKAGASKTRIPMAETLSDSTATTNINLK
jgi:hypothetical protein